LILTAHFEVFLTYRCLFFFGELCEDKQSHSISDDESS
jgi:hypothetical protein